MAEKRSTQEMMYEGTYDKDENSSHQPMRQQEHREAITRAPHLAAVNYYTQEHEPPFYDYKKHTTIGSTSTSTSTSTSIGGANVENHSTYAHTNNDGNLPSSTPQNPSFPIDSCQYYEYPYHHPGYSYPPPSSYYPHPPPPPYYPTPCAPHYYSTSPPLRIPAPAPPTLAPAPPSKPIDKNHGRDTNQQETSNKQQDNTTTITTSTSTSNISSSRTHQKNDQNSNKTKNKPKTPHHNEHTTYTKIWTCDVCKIAVFPSFREAETHEIACKKETNKNNIDFNHINNNNGNNHNGNNHHTISTNTSITNSNNSASTSSSKNNHNNNNQQLKFNDLTRRSKKRRIIVSSPSSENNSTHREEEVSYSTDQYLKFPICDIKGIKEVQDTLSPLNNLAVQQLCLVMKRELHINKDEKFTSNNEKAPMGHVALSCIHCGSLHSLVPAPNWSKAVYAIIHQHFLKSCAKIPKKLRDRLIELQKHRKYASSKRAKATGLKFFCNFISQYYKMEQVDIADGKMLVGIRGVPPHATVITNEKQIVKKWNAPTSPFHPKKTNKSSKDVVLAKHNNILSININSADQCHGKSGTSNNSCKDGERVIEGNQDTIHLPSPFGVPLVSSITETAASEISLLNKVIINHFEIFEERDSEYSCARPPPLVLRCQYCKSNFIQSFSTVNFHEILIGPCLTHVNSCECSSGDLVQSELATSSDIGSRTLKEYCQFLCDVYGIADTENGDYERSVPFAIWMDSARKYSLSSNYNSTPGELIKRQRSYNNQPTKCNQQKENNSTLKENDVALNTINTKCSPCNATTFVTNTKPLAREHGSNKYCHSTSNFTCRLRLLHP